MRQGATSFVIPTYRLREVGETIRQYDENFWRNGHAVDLIVFDDSTAATHERYYALLEQVPTHNRLLYVGPHEKARFHHDLMRRLGDERLTPIVKSLFRPSYGGNRNFTVMYTLGQLMVSADDDMRPEACMDARPETLAPGEVARGHLVRRGESSYATRSFDLLQGYLDVLGRPVAQVPSHYARGQHLVDTAMDLLTNASRGDSRDNALRLEPGALPDDAVVRIAQTYRTGTNDIDAVDFVGFFLDDRAASDPEALNDIYVLSNFRPAVTKDNWRMDCGVAGYDNRAGLPPFFPTRLRFEDYIYRLWVRQPGIAAAHIDAAQNHTKSTYMRNLPSAEVFNEEIANLIKRKLVAHPHQASPLTVHFDYDGEVEWRDTQEMLERANALHRRVTDAARDASEPGRREALTTLGDNLRKAFYGFEEDFAHQNVARIVDDVVSQIKGALALWPSLVETVYFQRNTGGLPTREVANPRLSAG